MRSLCGQTLGSGTCFASMKVQEDYNPFPFIEVSMTYVHAIHEVN